MDNIEAFMSFKNSLTNFKNIPNGDIQFPAIVTYRWGQNREVENLDVKLILAGYDQGQVCLMDGDRINIDTVHMEFKHEFGTFHISRDGDLVIQNTSGRLGRYEVIITPQ